MLSFVVMRGGQTHEGGLHLQAEQDISDLVVNLLGGLISAR